MQGRISVLGVGTPGVATHAGIRQRGEASRAGHRLGLYSDLDRLPPPEAPLSFIRACMSGGRVRWTHHVTMRLKQRLLNRELLLDSIDSLEIIEAYEERASSNHV